MFIFWVGLYYFNTLVLIPKILYQSKHILYILSLAVLFCLTVLFNYCIHLLLAFQAPFNILVVIYFRVPLFLLTIAAGIAFSAIENQDRLQKKVNETDREKLKTELSFLRSQISPHFIFNILNNIVSLARLKSPELEPTVMKLSGLMQYMLYHTEEEKVNLATELEYLEHYIDLQKQRFGKKVKITTAFNFSDPDLQIEPLLLIPFVENAFKHGTCLVHDPQINIELVTHGDNLNFLVQNKFDPSVGVNKDPAQGIGIANVRRRIELLYDKDYELGIQKNRNYFIVRLSLKLKYD